MKPEQVGTVIKHAAHYIDGLEKEVERLSAALAEKNAQETQAQLPEEIRSMLSEAQLQKIASDPDMLSVLQNVADLRPAAMGSLTKRASDRASSTLSAEEKFAMFATGE